MNLAFGNAISPAEVERLVSSWGDEGPGRFAVLCDAVAGWEAFRLGEVPQVTGRRSVADGGIDISVEVTSGRDQPLPPGSLLREGTNVLQVKFKSVLSGKPSSRLSSLKRAVLKAWVKVSEYLGQEPDRYLLFTNLDLSRAETEELIEAILDGADSTQRSRVQVVAASGLASFMNDRRSLLASFFWERSGLALPLYRDLHFKQYGLPVDAPLVGRDRELDEIRTFLSEGGGGRVVVLLGPRGRGKSRLALEALDRWRRNAVVVEEGDEIPPAFLKELEGTDPCVLLVEEPPRDKLEAWVRRGLGSETARLVLTLRHDRLSLGAWAQHERFREWSLPEIPRRARWDVVGSVAPGLDPALRLWLAEHSADSLEVLTIAASRGEGLRQGAGGLRASVGRELAREATQQLPPGPLQALRRLSLVTRVNLGTGELEALSRLPLAGDPAKVGHAELRALIESGFLQERSGTLEVVPSIRGDTLFRQALEADPQLPGWAFRTLPSQMLDRFLQRASRSGGAEVWRLALDPDSGVFRAISDFTESGRVLSLALDADAPGTLEILRCRLTAVGPVGLLGFRDEGRRFVMGALESLLTLEETAPGALQLIALLAAAETETVGNRASAVLGHALAPLAPQFALYLESRLAVVRKLQSHPVEAVREALARALRDAMADSFGGGFPSPQASRPGAWEWVRQLVERPSLVEGYTTALLDLASDHQQSVRSSARSDLLRAVGPGLGFLGSSVLNRLALLIDEMVQDPEVPISRAEAREWLQEARKSWPFAAALEELARSLEGDTLAARLGSLLGSWPPLTNAPDNDWTREMRAAIEEVLRQPEALPAGSWRSMASDHSPGALFALLELRRQDRQGRVWPLLLQAFRSTPCARWELLGAYLCDREDLPALLCDLEPLDPGDLLSVLVSLRPSTEIVRRVADLLAPSPDFRRWLGHRMHLRLWEGLEELQTLQLLTALAGPEEDTPEAAVAAASHLFLHVGPPPGPITDALLRWLSQGLDPLSDLPREEVDRLARQLAERDPEAGFRLLEKLLAAPSRILGWNPLSRRSAGSFWAFLLKGDSDRALTLAYLAEGAWGDEGALVACSLRKGLDPMRDDQRMLSFASRGDAQADFIAGCLDPDFSERFWVVARSLIESHPLPDRVSRGLVGSVLLGPTARVGTEEQYRIQALGWARERAAEEQDPAVLQWLGTVLRELEGAPAPQVLWEYDLPREEFLRILQDPASPDHRWAAERLLREAPWQEVRRHLSLQDLQALVPEADLPPKRKRALMAALKVWARGA